MSFCGAGFLNNSQSRISTAGAKQKGVVLDGMINEHMGSLLPLLGFIVLWVPIYASSAKQDSNWVAHLNTRGHSIAASLLASLVQALLGWNPGCWFIFLLSPFHSHLCSEAGVLVVFTGSVGGEETRFLLVTHIEWREGLMKTTI